MNCCNDYGDYRQGRDCPVRRQRAYPETLPTDLPIWPQRANVPDWRERLLNVVSAAGYAGLLMILIGSALLAIHAWTAWWIA